MASFNLDAFKSTPAPTKANTRTNTGNYHGVKADSDLKYRCVVKQVSTTVNGKDEKVTREVESFRVSNDMMVHFANKAASFKNHEGVTYFYTVDDEDEALVLKGTKGDKKSNVFTSTVLRDLLIEAGISLENGTKLSMTKVADGIFAITPKGENTSAPVATVVEEVEEEAEVEDWA